MVRILAILAGLAFIFAGVVGYGAMPQFMQDGLLFGYFEVDSMHNLIHIATGVIALICASSTGLSRFFFILIGLVYGVAAGAGFVRDGDLYIMHVNMADNYLHATIAAVFILIGLIVKA